jgi:predicted enzyme related to lactoylglutathione lyase
MATRRRSAARSTAKRRTSTPRSRARRAAASKHGAAKRSAAAPGTARPARATGAIGMLSQHMDYTTQSMDEVRRFYAELLGFDQARYDASMGYFFVGTGPTSSLGFMPPMEGSPDQWRPPREPAIYFMVKDVDAAHRALSARGVAFDQPPQDMPWGHRLALLRDPEGRRVCLAEEKAARARVGNHAGGRS